MAAPILWAPGKMRPFCRKSHVNKIPRFRGGVFGVLGRAGSADFIFMGARIFLIKGAEKNRNLQRQPFGQPFLRTMPSPLLWHALTEALSDKAQREIFSGRSSYFSVFGYLGKKIIRAKLLRRADTQTPTR